MKEIRFDKMHGLGNDYIYINLDEYPIEDLGNFAKKYSHRRFGIGGDGVITYNKEPNGLYKMRIFNIDGSEGLMCGNAIRCVAKLLYERGLCKDNPMSIDTASGIKILELKLEGEEVTSVRVDMGSPKVGEKLMVMEHEGTLTDVGNPHFVHFMQEDLDDYPLEVIGPKMEFHESFPTEINFEIAQVQNRHLIKMRVWERGSGLTWACGTGATATAVAAISAGLAESPVTISMPGGDLSIEWSGNEADSAFMIGSATHVFEGVIKI